MATRGLAFFAWDNATKHGHLPLLGALSCLAPLLSTLLLLLFGLTPMSWSILAAATLIVLGAAIAAFGPAPRSGLRSAGRPAVEDQTRLIGPSARPGKAAAVPRPATTGTALARCPAWPEAALPLAGKGPLRHSPWPLNPSRAVTSGGTGLEGKATCGTGLTRSGSRGGPPLDLPHLDPVPPR